MAGDETKRSEARTEPEVSAAPSQPPADSSEGAAPSEPPVPPAAEEPGTTDETASAEAGEAAEPPAVVLDASTSASADAAAEPAATLGGRAEPRARTPLLPRLIPYLVVFALGALITIGAAFIMNFLGGPPPETLGELDRRLAAMDERAAALERRQAQDSTTLRALADRFGAAETHARQAAAAVLEVEKALAARPTLGGDGTSRAPVDLGPLAARLAAIEQKLEQDTAGSGSDAGGAAAAGIAQVQAQVQATAIVAGRLVQEVERGDTYLHELNALLALGVDDSELAALRPFATTGVASLRRSADEFAKLAPAVLATERKGTDDSLVERLKGYASNLVQIERAGDLAGTDVHALVARIKLALAHDHVADAYALWSQLPEAAKIASERFGTSAKNRLDALAAARSIESNAVAALGKPKS